MPQGPGTYGSAVGRPPKQEKSPTKSGFVPYTPFKMKAADYNNSPMQKNFPNDIGNSPAKIFGIGGGKIIKGMKGRRKQAQLAGGGGAGGGGAIPHGDEAHTGGGGGEVAAQEMVGAEGAGGDVPMEAGGGGAGGAMPAEGAAQLAGGGPVEIAKKMMARKRGGLKGRKMGAPQGGGGFIGLSDARIKENIEKIGISPSNIPIYKFNYKGRKETWSGTMAQDLLIMGMSDVVTKDKSGHYIVDYNKIDVDMHLLN